MPHLQTISLALDLSVDLDVDGFPQEQSALTIPDRAMLIQCVPGGVQLPFCGKGAIKLMLINGAIDEALARAIFSAISTGKLSNSMPLQKVMVWPAIHSKRQLIRGYAFMNLVLMKLAQPWNVAQYVRDNCQPVLQVSQLGPSACDHYTPPLPPASGPRETLTTLSITGAVSLLRLSRINLCRRWSIVFDASLT